MDCGKDSLSSKTLQIQDTTDLLGWGTRFHKIDQKAEEIKTLKSKEYTCLKTLSWAETSASKFIICSSKIGTLAACC